MEGVHPDAKYRLVAVVRLVGIQLVVMVHSKHYQYVRNIDIDTVGTGILGKMVEIKMLRFTLVSKLIFFVRVTKEELQSA